MKDTTKPRPAPLTGEERATYDAMADRLHVLLRRRLPPALAGGTEKAETWAHLTDRDAFLAARGPDTRFRYAVLSLSAVVEVLLRLGLPSQDVIAASHAALRAIPLAELTPAQRRALKCLTRALGLLTRLVRAGCVARREVPQ